MSGEAQRRAPIGVFDSGVGGLTVLHELRRALGRESTIYLGDEARMPYGPRAAQEVLEFSKQAMRWFADPPGLATQQCKLVVLACNTSTAVALDTVRDLFDLPIIGVVRPGAVAAVSASARRHVGVVATEGTVRSGAYLRAVRDVDPLTRVTQVACPELVPIVEAGEASSPRAQDAVRRYCEPLVAEGVDTVLLGCTHYPLLRSAFETALGPGVRVVDSARTTALAVREVLESHHLLRDGDGATHRVFATGPRERFRAIARTIFGEELPTIEEAHLGS